MNTYFKYSNNLEPDQFLNEQILAIQGDSEDFMAENYALNQTNSKKRVNQKLSKLFAKFDQKGRDYDIQGLNELEYNLKNLMIAVKEEMRENDHGSERCALFIDYIAERVPKMYTRMIREHRHAEEDERSARRRDIEEEMNKLNHDIKEKIEELEEKKEKYQFYNSGDEQDGEASDDDPYYDEDEDEDDYDEEEESYYDEEDDSEGSDFDNVNSKRKLKSKGRMTDASGKKR